MTSFPRIYRPDGSATKTGIELAIQTLQTAKAANGAMYAPTRRTQGGAQSLPDLLNPAADPAVRGSVRGSEITDTGLFVPPIAGNYAETPDSAVFVFTNNIDLRASLTATDWTPVADRGIAGQWVTAGNQRAFRLVLDTFGSLAMHVSPDGTTIVSASSNSAIAAAAGVADGQRLDVRCTVDVNDGLGNRVFRFFYKLPTQTEWTLFGTPFTTVGTTSVFNSTAPFAVGSGFNGVEQWDGTIHSAELRNGIGGPVMASPDFDAQLPGTISFRDLQGNPWTVTTTGVDVNDPRLLPHTTGQDYVWLPGTASNSITFPRPYATTHFTITYTDDTTTTGTTTADPVVIGGTAHSGSVKSVVLRETSGAGAIGETLIVTNGLTGWTVNRSATGLKTAIVTRPIIMPDGTDDYGQLPASATPTFTKASGKHTGLMLLRDWQDNNFRRVYSSETGNLNGLSIQLDSGGVYLYCGDGSTFAGRSLPRPADGVLFVAAFVVNEGQLALYTSEGGLGPNISLSGITGTITHGTPRLLSFAYAAGGVAVEFLNFIDVPGQALTLTELDALSEYLKAGAYL